MRQEMLLKYSYLSPHCGIVINARYRMLTDFNNTQHGVI